MCVCVETLNGSADKPNRPLGRHDSGTSISGEPSMRAFFACVAMLSLPFGAMAQPAKSPSDEQIAQWVRELDSDEFVLREAAQRALLRVEGRALAPLHEALKAPLGLEFQCRAEKILKQLAIFEPAGPVAGGLKVRLSVDKPAAKLGDTV